jgi:hypothetical protein
MYRASRHGARVEDRAKAVNHGDTSTANPPHTMAKSKFFRVATEGATTDGRVIQRSWIEQIVKNFSPVKYGARIWMEHMRGMYPDSVFKAYGDVVAVKSEQDADGKLALFAQLDPTPELVAMSKARQKIYTSIEVTPKFADTGEAYLTGLGVTDTPASLGTEMLAFSAAQGDKSPLKARKSHPDAVFSEAVEFKLELEDEPGPSGDDALAKFKAGFSSMLDKFKGKTSTDNAMFGEVLKGFETFGDQVTAAMDAQAKKFAADLQALRDEAKTTADALTALKTDLSKQPGTHSQQRPPATGGNGKQLTDC